MAVAYGHMPSHGGMYKYVMPDKAAKRGNLCEKAGVFVFSPNYFRKKVVSIYVEINRNCFEGN